MCKEMKIVLPLYKIAYSICFIVILSLIRGVTATYEVGIALEAPVGLLAAVCCGDTYTQEISSKRSEIFRLYPIEKRLTCIFQRLLIQECFLLLLATVGYGLFFVWQNPFIRSENERKEFVLYLGTMVVTISFWVMLSNTLSCIFRNMWIGIGGCLVLWIAVNSSFGDKYLGSWNLFSYTFRNVTSGDYEWLWGKLLSIILCSIMLVVFPAILKKRG